MFSPAKGISKKNQAKISQTHRSFKNKHFPNSVTFDKREINGTIKSTIPRVDSYALSIQVRNSTTVFTRTTIFQISWQTSIKIFGKFLFQRTTILQDKNKTTHTVTKSDCFTRQGFSKKS